ncbi:MAG: hypothetical protein ACRD5G_00330 [Candidatus Acidiferrales bacterium]
MTRPDAAHRIKSYSSETGYTFQYYFHEVNKSRRGFAAGNEYVFMISADRKTMFPLRIFVRADAVRRWGQQVGRPLSGTEEYAAAKMRLFQALDEVEALAQSPPQAPELEVNSSNLDDLLRRLDI